MQTVETYSQLELDLTNYTAGFFPSKWYPSVFHLNTETRWIIGEISFKERRAINSPSFYLSLTVNR